MAAHNRNYTIYTPTDPPRVHIPPSYVRIVASANGAYLVSGLLSAVLALPIALVMVPGVLRVVGGVYLVVWLLVLSPSTGTYLLMLVDCVLIMRGKEPVVLLRALEAESNEQRSERPAIERYFRRLAEFSVRANPISNLVTATLHFTVRHRPHVFAEAIARSRETPRIRTHSPEITVEIAVPVMSAVPDFVAESNYALA
jgi:hypothetical protein